MPKKIIEQPNAVPPINLDARVPLPQTNVPPEVTTATPPVDPLPETPAPTFVPPSAKLDPQTIRVMKADQTEHDIKVVPQILKNTRGEDMSPSLYFFASEGKEAVAPNFFNKAVGLPIYDGNGREDLIEIFDKIFKPEDGFVFLKSRDKEFYGILVPLKYTDIGNKEDNIFMDYQVHGISFVNHGSVNYDILRDFFKKVVASIKYNDR